MIYPKKVAGQSGNVLRPTIKLKTFEPVGLYTAKYLHGRYKKRPYSYIMIAMLNSTTGFAAGKSSTNGTSTGRRIHYGIWVLIVGILTVFGSIGLGRFAIGMIIPEMGIALSLTNTQLGLIVSGTFFGYLASTAVSGHLSSLYGPKKVIAGSMFLIVFGMLMASSATGFWMAVAGQLLIGIGTGGSNVPTMGLVTRWYARKFRGTASGLMTVGSGLGFALAGTLVPFLIAFYGADGWRASWFYLGAIVLAIAFLGVLVFRNSPGEAGHEPVGGADVAPDVSRVESLLAASRLNTKALYRSRSLAKLGATYFMYGFSYVIFTTFFAKYLIEEVGFSAARAGGLWSTIGAVSIVSGFLWGMLSDKVGRKQVLFIVYLLQGLALAALSFTKDPGLVVAVSLVYALTLWSVPAIMAATCADYVGGVLAPAAFAIVTLYFGAGQVISPWISGYIVDVTGNFSVPFMVSAAAGFAGAALSLMLSERVDMTAKR